MYNDFAYQAARAKMEYLFSFLQWLLLSGTTPKSSLYPVIPFALACLVFYNEGLLLSGCVSPFVQEETCWRLVENIPPVPHPHAAARLWFEQYWGLRPTERLTITLTIEARINQFLSSMLQRWHEETTA